MPILTYRSSNPLVDGRQSDSAMMIQRGVVRHFQINNVVMVPELTLANGMRADLTGIDEKGRIIVVEIKSSVEDYKADHKWHIYHEFCDQFYFASHAGVGEHIFPQDEGFILADEYGADILREAAEKKLSAARRKSMTLRFARAAATRLERVIGFGDLEAVPDVD